MSKCKDFAAWKAKWQAVRDERIRANLARAGAGGDEDKSNAGADAESTDRPAGSKRQRTRRSAA